jgi:deoxyribonuclease (pyrimidine dimer)
LRCNIIDVKLLADQHLIAERNELRFIPPLLSTKYQNKGLKLIKDIPKDYCLGKGHMNFWLNKMLYLENRYNDITNEMITRNFKPNPAVIFDVTLAQKIGMYLDWEPQEKDYYVIAKRIKEKLLMKVSWYRYKSVPIDLNWIENIYGGV